MDPSVWASRLWVSYGLKVISSAPPPSWAWTYGPYEITRGVLRWHVSRADWFAGGYDIHKRFWTKKAATAELVRMALEGKEVKL